MSDPFQPPTPLGSDDPTGARRAANLAAVRGLLFGLAPVMTCAVSLCYNPCFALSMVTIGLGAVAWNRADALQMAWEDDLPGWTVPTMRVLSIVGVLLGLGSLGLNIAARYLLLNLG